MRKLFRGVVLLFRAGFSAAPALALFGFFLEPVGWFVQAFTALWLKWVVDGINAGSPGAVRTAAIGLGATIALSMTIASFGWRLRTQLLERSGAWLDERVMRLTADMPGLEHHERAEYHDKIEILQRSGLGTSIIGLVGTIACAVQVGTTAVLLATVHPLLALLPLFGAPSLWLTARAQELSNTANEAATPYWRRSGHLYWLAINASPAKELRVFGLEDDVRRRHGDERAAGEDLVARAGLRGAGLHAIGWVVFALGYGAAIGFVSQRAIAGEATLGEVVFVITLAAQINTVFSTMVTSLRWLLQSVRAAEHFLWLEDMYRSERRRPGSAAVLRSGIRFEDVSFVYPGTSEVVLDHIDLELPAGKRVAIVGENGAGKTTLVKLLCGFYRPTSGRILLDGTDLEDVDLGAWREGLAAAFQDYCRFEVKALQAVGVGDPPRVEDRSAVGAALVRAGGEEVPRTLPQGLDTLLGKSFEGGTDLSGGQWQKLALGRAMMRAGPLLLILDEPTASLDAKTEHALFRRYAEAAAAHTAEGGITVLVSHRFSTVRNADLIVVVADGRIVEVGPHDDLVRRGGTYAELFNLQARGYR